MLTIKCEEPYERACACCGGVTVTLTRFVYEDGDAAGAYLARFGREHPERVVVALVSVGPWGDSTGPWDRVAFPMRLWSADDAHQVGLTDRAESPWHDVELFGRILDRAEALADERVQQAFHISDHMVADDALLRDYLNGAV